MFVAAVLIATAFWAAVVTLAELAARVDNPDIEPNVLICELNPATVERLLVGDICPATVVMLADIPASVVKSDVIAANASIDVLSGPNSKDVPAALYLIIFPEFADVVLYGKYNGPFVPVPVTVLGVVGFNETDLSVISFNCYCLITTLSKSVSRAAGVITWPVL